MKLILTSKPTNEPLSLATALNHLKADSGEDNALISALIKTARQLAEKETKRAFITQTWKMYLDKALPEIIIPNPPLQSIESIKALSGFQSIVDETSAVSQAVLSTASTVGFEAEDTIIVNRDGAREEEKTILSVQVGESLTLTENLEFAHTSDQADRVEKYTLVSKAEYNVDRSENSPGRVKLRAGYSWPVHREFASFIIEFKAGYGDNTTDVPDALRHKILQLIGYLYENRGAEEIPKGISFQPYKIYWL